MLYPKVLKTLRRSSLLSSKLDSHKKKLRRLYLRKLETDRIPIPRIIHVETRSKCNGACGFCPASIHYDKREDNLMPETMIEKIISQLSDWSYSNRLSFYNNNEPFLDKRIYGFIENDRKKLPKAYLELKTNGIFLDLERITDVFNAGLDMLYINNYSTDKKLKKNIQKLEAELNGIRRFKGHFGKFTYFSRIIIANREIDAVMRSRGGIRPNKMDTRQRALRKYCLRPFEMMTINSEGNISTCSEDFHFSILMGNIKVNTLQEIWTSGDWNRLRENLIKENRNYTSTCAKCDYKGFTYEILKENNLYDVSLQSRIRQILASIFGN